MNPPAGPSGSLRGTAQLEGEVNARHAGESRDGDVGGARAELVARLLLTGGRALLVLGPLSTLIARLAKPTWSTAPLDGGGVPSHPVIQVALCAALAFSFALPFLILPVGSVWLARTVTGVLAVRTVTGTRRIDLRTTRVSAAWLPGRGWSTWMYLLKDSTGRWVIVGHSLLRQLPDEFGAVLVGSGASAPRLSPNARYALGIDPPTSRRFGIYAAGWLLIVAWTALTIAAFGLLFALSGAM